MNGGRTAGASGDPEPGVLVVWSGATPCLMPFRVGAKGLTIGRELLGSTGTDDRISRRHVKVTYGGGRFAVTDLGSRNGTYAGGQAIVDREITVTAPCVLRAGRTVGVIVDDVTRYEGHAVVVEPDRGMGPSSAPVYARPAAAGAVGRHVAIVGEPGCGKRLVAAAYLRVRAGGQVLIQGGTPVIPDALPRGTTSVLIEQPQLLPVPAQVALLKLIGRRRELGVVSLAPEHPDLWRELDGPLVAALAAEVIDVPPLRSRFDEVGYLVAMTVRAVAPTLAVHSTLIEEALLRPWPGNLRELRGAVTRTATALAGAGKTELRSDDLESEAGHLAAGQPTVNHGVQSTMKEGQLALGTTDPSAAASGGKRKRPGKTQME